MDNCDYGLSIFNALYDRGNKIIKKKEMRERKEWSRLFEKSLKEGFNNYTIIDSPSIYYHDEELPIDTHSESFYLLTRIQDEVHRFAITYMKTKHQKTSYALTLTQVPGIGEKRAQKLLLTYKTRALLKAATPQQLAETAGVNAETAQQLYALIQELPDL